MISNDPLDIANSKETLDIYDNIGRTDVRVILNNSYRSKIGYFKNSDISDIIGHKIDYIIDSSLYIKNIDKYIMEGKILVLNNKIDFVNPKDKKWYINLANDLCEVTDGEQEEKQ